MLVAGAYGSVLFWVAAHPALLPLLVVVLAAPKAFATIRLLTATTARPVLNQALRSAAQLHLQFGILLAAGIVISRLMAH